MKRRILTTVLHLSRNLAKGTLFVKRIIIQLLRMKTSMGRHSFPTVQYARIPTMYLSVLLMIFSLISLLSPPVRP